MNNYDYGYNLYSYQEPPRRKRGSGGFPRIFFTLLVSACMFGTGLGLGLGFSDLGNTAETEDYISAAELENYVSVEQLQDYISADQLQLLLEELSSKQESVVNDSGVISIAQAGQNTNSVADVFKVVRDSVVSINVTGQTTNFFNMPVTTSGAGSGIVYSQDDEKIYIVTNYHVINGANKASISFDDKIQISANYVGGDEELDIAVISVKKSDLAAAGISKVQVATFADSSKIMVGDAAIAVGNALGEGKSATLGIISAISKTIPTENGNLLDVIQTDAAINNGNSGGALVNADGHVVGLNTAKVSASGIEGMGYAIPSNQVTSIVAQIMKTGKVEKPYLGISNMIDVTNEIKATYNLPSVGVYVNSVEYGGTAALAGITRGDIIIGVNGSEITTQQQLNEFFQTLNIGDRFTIEIYRTNRNVSQKLTLDATVANKPSATNF